MQLTASGILNSVRCPFCNQEGPRKNSFPKRECEHFVGWTENGRDVIRHDNGITEEMLPKDKVVTTGVTARVYRDTWALVGTPVVERCKNEILDDIAAGRIPRTVATFSELHNFVDGNEYGGACEEDGEHAFDGSDEACDFWNRVQNEVHEWLVAGRPSGLSAGQEASIKTVLAPVAGLVGNRRLLDVLYGPDAKKLRRDIVAIADQDQQVRISDKRCQWGNFREKLLALAGIDCGPETCKAAQDQAFELVVRCIFLRNP